MYRYLLAAGIAAIVGFAFFFFSSTSEPTQAGPPVYWITMDESEMEHIRASSAPIGNGQDLEVVERRSGYAIVKLDELGSQDLSSRMHDEFHKCAGFFRHETLAEAQESIDLALNARTDLQLVNYTIDNQANVMPMLGLAAEPNIRQMIIDLSALHTRRHDQQGGTDGANLIWNRWRAIATGRTDITVTPYAHLSPTNPDVFLTQQPSIVATVTGTEFPDEIVIVGGHQDSIRSGSTTGAAPGADDDASGIAATTEILRTVVETGFRPKRTVQFMAYAAEEVGLVGSKNIADTYFAQNRNVVGVLQLDMVNYSGPWADIVMITDNTNAAQNQFVRDLVAAYQPTLVVKNDACGYGCSDHASWHARGYPASMPFEAKYSSTGGPREYNTALHTANDTIARSNGEAHHALKFAKLGISFVGELAKGEIPTVKTQTLAAFDFDSDGKTDVSIFRPFGGTGGGEWWYLRSSDGGASGFAFGSQTDTPVPADFTGDGKTDIAFWREITGEWFVLRSEDSTFFAFPYGTAGDIPMPGDYDGDGEADATVFRPSTNTWYSRRSSDGVTTVIPFGQAGDLPISADFDGDGKTDIAVFRPNGGSGAEWWYQRSSDGGSGAYSFGSATDKAVPADFTGDGKADIAFWRPSTGEWYILRSEDDSFYAFPFGVSTDIPVPGDYDGDGKADAAVFRPSNNTWYMQRSTAGFEAIAFGSMGDKPLPNVFVR